MNEPVFCHIFCPILKKWKLSFSAEEMQLLEWSSSFNELLKSSLNSYLANGCMTFSPFTNEDVPAEKAGQREGWTQQGDCSDSVALSEAEGFRHCTWTWTNRSNKIVTETQNRRMSFGL